jgi:hypothetical protein
MFYLILLQLIFYLQQTLKYVERDLPKKRMLSTPCNAGILEREARYRFSNPLYHQLLQIQEV